MRLTNNFKLIASVAALLAIDSIAQADLTIDLRFIDGRHNQDYVPGDHAPITINAWAIVTGSAGNNNPEGLLTTILAIKSNIISGGVSGSITSATLATGWNGPGSQVGTASNLSADAIGDWGNASNNSIGSGLSSFFRPRTNKSINNPVDWGDANSTSTFNQLADGGVEFLVGSFVFTPTSMPAGSIFQFVPVTPLSGTTAPAGWYEDTSDKTLGTPTGARSHVTGIYGPSTPNSAGTNAVISIGVPEPTTLGFLGLMGMGLLKRIRK